MGQEADVGAINVLPLDSGFAVIPISKRAGLSFKGEVRYHLSKQNVSIFCELDLDASLSVPKRRADIILQWSLLLQRHPRAYMD